MKVVRFCIFLFLTWMSLFMLTACGQDQAGSGGIPPTTDFDDTCFNNPDSYECQIENINAENMGYESYDPFNDYNYNRNSQRRRKRRGKRFEDGFCGCRTGLVPVLIYNRRGQPIPRCIRSQGNFRRGERIRVRITFNNNHRGSLEFTDSVSIKTTNRHRSANKGCHRHAMIGCNPMRTKRCRIRNNWGETVSGRCVQVSGQNYGLCLY